MHLTLEARKHERCSQGHFQTKRGILTKSFCKGWLYFFKFFCFLYSLYVSSTELLENSKAALLIYEQMWTYKVQCSAARQNLLFN